MANGDKKELPQLRRPKWSGQARLGVRRLAKEMPLREEPISIQGIKVRFEKQPPQQFHWEPGDTLLKTARDGMASAVDLPPLNQHALVVGESG
ncbi:MAG: hypothetical protein ACJ8FY_17690 [Gemmataceae bacterium]